MWAIITSISCFVRASTTHLFCMTCHGSYRKIFQKLVQVQLSPFRRFCCCHCHPVKPRVTQAVRHTLCAGDLLPMRGTKCPQYPVLHSSKVSYPTRKLSFSFCFQFSKQFPDEKKSLTGLCSAPTTFHSRAASMKLHFACLVPPTMLLLPKIICSWLEGHLLIFYRSPGVTG